MLATGWQGYQAHGPGAILIDGTRFEVRKHGFLSGQWTLEHEGIAAASAQKSNPFTRTFEVRAAGDDFVLRAQSAMGRTFLVERGERTVATIAPEHPFTRRARIECQSDECDFVTLCFLFWLAAITWRRAAQSNS